MLTGDPKLRSPGLAKLDSGTALENPKLLSPYCLYREPAIGRMGHKVVVLTFTIPMTNYPTSRLPRAIPQHFSRPIASIVDVVSFEFP